MDKPLFSIVVITYNSSKYVLETLESIKNQTYDNIELIISDDCSKDNTVQLCREWLLNHKKHFINSKLVTTKENSGIPANCNRGIRASKGDWIKIIAGDDLLINTAISHYENYIKSSLESGCNPYFIFSRIAIFDNDPSQAREIYNDKISNYILFNPELSQKEQTKLYCRGQLIQIITMVFNKDIFEVVGGFDEEYPLREDRPFVYKILLQGYKIYFMNKLTFLYRQHSESVMHIKRSRREGLEIKINNIWAPQLKYRFPNLSTLEKGLARIHYFNDITEFKVLSSKNRFKLKLIFTKAASKLIHYLDRFIHYILISKYKNKFKNSYSYTEIQEK